MCSSDLVPREPTDTSIDQPCSFAHWHTLSPTPDVGPELTTGPPRNRAASSSDSREQESIAVRLLGVAEGPATVFFAVVAVVVRVVAVAEFVSVAVAAVDAVDFAAEPELVALPPQPAIISTHSDTSAAARPTDGSRRGVRNNDIRPLRSPVPCGTRRSGRAQQSANIGSSLRIRILSDPPGWTIEISIVVLG